MRETETNEMEGEKALDYFWQAHDFDAIDLSPQYVHQIVVTVKFAQPHYLWITLKKEAGRMKILRVEDATR